MKINMRCKLCQAYKQGFCKITGDKTQENHYCPYGVMMRLIRAIKIYGRRDKYFQTSKKVIRQTLDDICNLTGLSDYLPVLNNLDEFEGLDLIEDKSLPKIMKTAKDLFQGEWVRKDVFTGEDEK